MKVIQAVYEFAFAVASGGLVFVLPLACLILFSKRCWKISGNVIVATSSWVLITTSLYSLLVTLHLWGWIGVIIGLLLVGVGINAVSVAATVINGQWPALLSVLAGLSVMFGLRLFGIWVLHRHSERIVAG